MREREKRSVERKRFQKRNGYREEEIDAKKKNIKRTGK